MILYLDTSDLFKVYVREADSERAKANVGTADRLASSRLAYVEMRAALAKAFRDGRLSHAGIPIDHGEYDDLVGRFKTDWRAYIKVTVSNSVITNAGDLAEKHGLRGSDAVHLSSAVRLRNLSLDEVRVSVADRELRTAALAEGFVVV